MSFIRLQNNRIKVYGILILLVLLAALIRAPGLGKWGLTVDEYYFSQSVSFILEKGLPEFPGGGYYTRGIVLQYLTAVSASLIDDWELAVRVIPLLFGILSVPMFYLLCRIALPSVPALLCSVILILSSWHIEFSRFARMYSAFQFSFLVFLYLFYSGYWYGNRRYQIASWIVAFFSIILHEASIFIPVILLLAIFMESSPVHIIRRWELAMVSGMLVFINYLVHGISYATWGVENAPVVEKAPVVEISSSLESLPFVLPKFSLLSTIWHSSFFTAGYSMLVVAAVFLIIRVLRTIKDPWTIALIALTAVFPLLHQFGVLLCVFLLFVVGRRSAWEFLMRKKQIWALYLGVVFAFWVVVGFFMEPIWLFGSTQQMFLKKLASILFHYPRINDAIVRPFLENVPIWSLFVFALILISVFHHSISKRATPNEFLLMVILLCLFLIPVFRTTYVSTRYSFFFFPLILIIAYGEADALRDWIQKKRGMFSIKPIGYAMLGIPLLAFAVSEDFHLDHVLRVSSQQVNFRMGRYADLAGHWYPRADYDSPAQYVNQEFQEGDVIVTDSVTATSILDKPFMVYVPKDKKRFRGVQRDSGNTEKWTGRPLVYDEESLFGFIPNNADRKLWLIVVAHKVSYANLGNPEELAQRYGFRAQCVFKGLDRRIEVWKLTQTA